MISAPARRSDNAQAALDIRDGGDGLSEIDKTIVTPRRRENARAKNVRNHIRGKGIAEAIVASRDSISVCFRRLAFRGSGD